MKKCAKQIGIVSLFLIMALSMMFTVKTNAASQKSDGKNMEKTLKYIKQNNYSKARKYNNKLSETTIENCTLKMSKKMKKAYLKIVNRYPTNGFGENTVIRDYYLTDIDNDKKADLMIVIGSCEGDSRLIVYRYKKGKAVKAGSIDAIHTSYRAYPNHKGVVEVFGLNGEMTISVLTIKKNKLVRKEIGTMDYEALGGTYNLRGRLKSHYRTSGSWYNRYTWMDTADLR